MIDNELSKLKTKFNENTFKSNPYNDIVGQKFINGVKKSTKKRNFLKKPLPIIAQVGTLVLSFLLLISFISNYTTQIGGVNGSKENEQQLGMEKATPLNLSCQKGDSVSSSIKGRNSKENLAQEITLKSGGTYKVDNKNFKPGFYDIISLEGNAEIASVNLHKGERFLSKQIFKNNSIEVEGNGMLLLCPSEFKKEKMINKVYTLKDKSVSYQAGEEIEPGTYELQVTNEIESSFYVFVDINNYEENSLDAQSFNIRDTGTYTFSIKEEEMLEILNWSDKDTELKIKMKQIDGSEEKGYGES
ncbi:hypothetical protein H9655_14715 [Cytobacillus sp. Sa5YUA1]|uniref:FecR protein domain-containing protein n=1 Tax=Cytobacillus stercorigallinarum TaxID=2762240 RepID=A0ABR8QRV8_9BACI|nr:hypothetical protein [Cytobacillus stercorigallinarum]MBD7938284.1 hypothetical protein [Cytobacillus stercorigallinarum]